MRGRGARNAMPEKRVDPCDGNAYTRAEFVEQYGGADEWNAAAQGAGRGAKKKPDAAMQEYIDKVKAAQRESPGFRAAWGAFVEENELPGRDPALLDTATLKRGLAEAQRAAAAAAAPAARGRGAGDAKRIDPSDGRPYTMQQFFDEYGGYAEWSMAAPAGGGGRGRPAGGRPSSAGATGGPRSTPYTQQAWAARDKSKESIIARVQACRKSDSSFNSAWKKHCDEHCRGFYDPYKMEHAALVTALAAIEGADVSALVDMAMWVRNQQRSDSAFKERWIEFCDTQPGQFRDPTRMDAAQLRKGLRAAAPDELARLELAASVKQHQRSSAAFKQAWIEHCDAEASGFRDPFRMKLAQLKKAWAATKSTASTG